MTTLKQVREAAEQCKKHSGLYDVTNIVAREVAGHICADHILSTIEPDADEPVTEEWLREVWGFRDDTCWESEDEEIEQSLVESGCYKCIEPEGVLIWCDATGLTLGRDGYTETIVQFLITTRHQFSQLAQALGIKRKGE